MSALVYTNNIPDPYDLKYSHKESYIGNSNFIGGFIPNTNNNKDNKDIAYLDCHSNIVFCDPTVTENINSQCLLCSNIGGGVCIENLQLSNNNTRKIGVCAPRGHGISKKQVNHFTTDITVGIVGDYSHKNTNNGIPIEQTIVTNTTVCKDERVARKNAQMIRANPLAEGFMSCDEIVLCGGEDIGYPIHPNTKNIIRSTNDVDFDIIGEASLLTCGCAEGYVTIKDSTTDLPKCVKGGGHRNGLICPVVMKNRDTGEVRCVCNPATQISLLEAVDSINKGGLSTDYGIEMVQALTAFKDELLDGVDTCIPKPGVDPRVSAFGYAFASHVFYDEDQGKTNIDENHSDVPFRLENNRGGHLMTGGLVRRGGITTGGDWKSIVMEYNKANTNRRQEKASYSIGGVSPYLGTGGVPAHIWGGDVFNDNNIVVCARETMDGQMIQHPNGTLKMVPPSITGIPAVGVSLEHAVGMVASAGRFYPGGIYKRGGKLCTKNNNYNKETSFYGRVVNMDRDNPLIQMMGTNDPGSCMSAFIVPFQHDKCNTNYEKNPNKAGILLPHEVAPTQRLGGFTGHHHVRPWALAMGYTPVERLFRFFCSKTKASNLAFPDNINVMFPHLIPDGLKIDDLLWSNDKSPNFSQQIDLLGGLFLQPTTVQGSGVSSLNTKWTEEMMSVNLPCLVDHYAVDDGRAQNELETDRGDIVYTRYPTAHNIVANQTGLYSGYSLNSGKYQSGFFGANCSKLDDGGSYISFTDSAVFGAENVIWNNVDFTPLALPQDIPVATLPEEIRFSARNAVYYLNKTSLADFGNKYANFESEDFQSSLGKNENLYNPPMVNNRLSKTNNIPQKYISDDCWIPGRVDGIVPSLNLAESYFRMRPIYSRDFFINKPNMLYKDWGTNPHTSGDIFQGLASAPCNKYELGGHSCYPSSGSLSQYVTLLSPRSFDKNGKAHGGANLNQQKILLNKLQVISKKGNENEISSLLMEASKNRNCNCLTDIFCTSKSAQVNNNNNNAPNVIAAAPSRGNRMAPYLFCRSTPKHHLPLLYAFLRAQNRDPIIIDAILKSDSDATFNVLQNRKSSNWNLPAAPNRFLAVKSNAAFTRFFAREPIIPYGRVVPLVSSPTSLDYHSDDILQRDTWQYNVRNGPPEYLLTRNKQGDLIHECLVDFFESSCRVSPNVICANTFSPWHEGPRGIVSMYGTPVMSGINNSPKTLPMRMIHTYAINTPYMGGFEMGQTPAEGMLTRGIETWYHTFVKPPLGDNVTTSLEGIRARTQEPFERLAVRGFREINWAALAKYSLLSHYGVDGLISFAYTDNKTPTRMTDGSARYPFACQSDRVPFPLSMQLTIQLCALCDMNVNNQIYPPSLVFDEKNKIVSQT
nr:MAG: wsv209-like protein [Metapenaeopsis lamellata majanivirus]